MTRGLLTVVARGRLSRAAAVGAVVVFPLAGTWWAADATTALRAVVLGIVVALAVVTGFSAPPRPLGLASAALLVVFVVAALTSATPLLSLLGRFPRYEGLAWLLACLVVASHAMGLEQRIREGFIPRCFAVLSVILAVSASFDAVVTPEMRIRTPMGNASDAGALAVTCLCVGLTLFPSSGARRTHWWQVFCVTGALLTVVLSASRGALVAAIVVMAVAALHLGIGRRLRSAMVVLGLVALTAASSLLAPMTRSRLLGDSPLATATVNGRLVLWSDTWELIKANPLLGMGPSRFVDEINPHHSMRWIAVLGDEAPPDSPHNLLLQVLASTGLLGVVAGLALVGVLAWCWWRRRDEAAVLAAVLAVTGLVVALSVHVSSPSIVLPVVVLIGMSLAPDARPAPLWGRGVAGLLAAVLLAAGVSLLVSESRLGAAVERATMLAPGSQRSLTEIRRQSGDPDFARRVAYVQVGLGWQGEPAPGDLVDELAGTCDRLPRSIECVLVLGQALEQQGRLDEAASVLGAAAEQSPNHSQLILARAIVDAQRGELEAAESQLLLLAELAPRSAAPWQNLALIYEQQDRLEEAARAREKATRLAGDG